jgi:hypothetical protein
MTPIDREALERAVQLCARQIDAKLRDEPWEDVARFCAFSAQIESLHLQPWESTVVYADSPEAHALLRRLKAAGLSKFEPDPLRALQRVEAEAKRQTAK